MACAPAPSWRLRILKGGAWALARAVPALLRWIQGYPLQDPLDVEWIEKGKDALLQGGCGVLYGACTAAELNRPISPAA